MLFALERSQQFIEQLLNRINARSPSINRKPEKLDQPDNDWSGPIFHVHEQERVERSNKEYWENQLVAPSESAPVLFPNG